MRHSFNRVAKKIWAPVSGALKSLTKRFRLASVTAAFAVAGLLSSCGMSVEESENVKRKGDKTKLILKETGYTHGGELVRWPQRQMMLSDTALAEGQNYTAFLQTLEPARNLPLIDKLKFVNQRVNNYVIFADDKDLYKKREYFASGVETVKNRQGDCDDYMILKFLALKHLGVSEDRLYLMLILIPDEGHAVLAVDTTENKDRRSMLVLDNADTRVLTLGRTRYVPTVVANTRERWEVIESGQEMYLPRNWRYKPEQERWKDWERSALRHQSPAKPAP